ncbi:MAG: glycosyltransferase [Clostridia bacterium]|nr:glycosyltransferase [Deltaproteobacteria bacterium]
MHVVLFAHSLLSDWNNVSAPFLRGIVSELVTRGHTVVCYERRDAASVAALLADQGGGPIEAVQRIYPALDVVRYVRATLDLDVALADADLVLVHQSTESELIANIGKKRLNGTFRALFHDTHYEVSDALDLSAYDGVLVFGNSLREAYLSQGVRNVWTWHEAADIRVLEPLQTRTQTNVLMKRDLVWIGNWGNDQAASFAALVFEPIRHLGLDADVYGVGYPEDVVESLKASDVRYRGWAAGYTLSEIFAHFYATLNIPPAGQANVPGVPTLRMYEAMACGIPLISAPWDDSEGLFTVGKDYLVAEDTPAMIRRLRDLLSDFEMADALADQARQTVLAKHTCAHRVDELLEIYRSLTI